MNRHHLWILALSGTLATAGLALAQDEAEWVLLSYQSLNGNGAAFMHPEPDEGPVTALRFQAQSRGVVVDRVRIDFVGEHEPLELRVGHRVRPNEEGPPIPLPEPLVIRRVRIRYRLMGGRQRRTTLNLLAQRAPTPAE